MRPARGFSLVEVLVTLLVLGIAAGAMSLAVTADRERDPAVAVEQLRKALETAAYRASIRPMPMELWPLAFKCWLMRKRIN